VSKKKKKNLHVFGSENSVLCFDCVQSSKSLVLFTANGKQM